MPDDITALEAALEVRAVLGRLRRRLREVSAGDALSPSQASVLARLAKGDIAVPSAASLAAAEGVRPQSMAATLGVLEREGLIRRVPDPGDGRRSLVEATDAGLGQEAGAGPARMEWFARVLGERSTAAERALVLQAMDVLERVLEP
jgi:DNA-binding MarR family transcriptional regulator